MAKQTKRDAIIEALIVLGSKEVPAKSSKYREFTRTVTVQGETRTDYKYFVGRMGALRTGTCISKSYSLEHAIPKMIARAAEVAAAKATEQLIDVKRMAANDRD